jgi:hypothetical protein
MRQADLSWRIRLFDKAMIATGLFALAVLLPLTLSWLG